MLAFPAIPAPPVTINAPVVVVVLAVALVVVKTPLVDKLPKPEIVNISTLLALVDKKLNPEELAVVVDN